MKYIKQFYVNDYEGNVINDFNQYKQNKKQYQRVDNNQYPRVDLAFYIIRVVY